LILGLLGLGHPALGPRDDICRTLEPIVAWWTVLHVAQIPLFALMGVAVFLLARDLPGRPAQIARWASLFFAVVYPAFDAAVGVASGVMLQSVGMITPAQRSVLEASLQNLFWGPVTLSIAAVGSVAWLIALVAVAWAWRRAGAPWPVISAFAGSGLLLSISHVRPFGPLACLLFLAGAAWVVFRGQRRLAPVDGDAPGGRTGRDTLTR